MKDDQLKNSIAQKRIQDQTETRMIAGKKERKKPCPKE